MRPGDQEMSQRPRHYIASDVQLSVASVAPNTQRHHAPLKVHGNGTEFRIGMVSSSFDVPRHRNAATPGRG